MEFRSGLNICSPDRMEKAEDQVVLRITTLAIRTDSLRTLLCYASQVELHQSRFEDIEIDNVISNIKTIVYDVTTSNSRNISKREQKLFQVKYAILTRKKFQDQNILPRHQKT